MNNFCKTCGHIFFSDPPIYGKCEYCSSERDIPCYICCTPAISRGEFGYICSSESCLRCDSISFSEYLREERE